MVRDDETRIATVEQSVGTALIWSIGIAALLGIGGGAWRRRVYLKRVDAIARTAEAIIDGDFGRRMPVRGAGDDLDKLADALNHMLDRINTLMVSLRQVSSDVAHDLRTPLSRLLQRLADARLHAGSVADYEAAIDSAAAEAERLLATFSALLRIAQVEGAVPRDGFREVDLSATADTVVDAYRPDAEEAGLVLLSEIVPDLSVQGDAELLTQAVANIVENAWRHTIPGTVITLRLWQDRACNTCLEVADNGPGVQPHDLPRLTNRFFRAQRSRTTAGSGLGLSLVAAVAELHGAAIRFHDATPGLRVQLTFPANTQCLR